MIQSNSALPLLPLALEVASAQRWALSTREHCKPGCVLEHQAAHIAAVDIGHQTPPAHCSLAAGAAALCSPLAAAVVAAAAMPQHLSRLPGHLMADMLLLQFD
jgi:hypothetical protein